METGRPTTSSKRLYPSGYVGTGECALYDKDVSRGVRIDMMDRRSGVTRSDAEVEWNDMKFKGAAVATEVGMR